MKITKDNLIYRIYVKELEILEDYMPAKMSLCDLFWDALILGPLEILLIYAIRLLAYFFYGLSVCFTTVTMIPLFWVRFLKPYYRMYYATIIGQIILATLSLYHFLRFGRTESFLVALVTGTVVILINNFIISKARDGHKMIEKLCQILAYNPKNYDEWEASRERDYYLSEIHCKKLKIKEEKLANKAKKKESNTLASIRLLMKGFKEKYCPIIEMPRNE